MAQVPQSSYGSPGGTGPSGPRSGFGSRLGAALIDSAILLAINLALMMLMDRVTAQALGYGLGALYYIALEGGATGQTIGKRAVGIRVIDFERGGPIGFGKAVGRYFARILSTIPLGLGYFWMLWDKEKQTWHDKLATSVVVPVSAYPVHGGTGTGASAPPG